MKNAGVDGIVMAAAGLKRLSLLPSNAEFLDPCLFLPAVNQGILAVQIRRNGLPELEQLISQVTHPAVERAFLAERSVRTVLQADCESSFAAYSWTLAEAQGMTSPSQAQILRARVLSPDGLATIEVCEQAKAEETAEQLGTRVGEILLQLEAKKLWSTKNHV